MTPAPTTSFTIIASFPGDIDAPGRSFAQALRRLHYWVRRWGGTAAKILTEGGLNVVMLEAGPPLNPEKDYKEHLWPYDLPHRGIGVGGKLRREINDEFT